MKMLLRMIVGVASLAAVIGWTVMILGVKDWEAPMAGAGDNAATPPESGGEQIFDVVIIGALWLVPISPYLCMAAGAFDLIGGKTLRVAYVYVLTVLSLMTLILLVSFQRRLEMMALGNVVVGSLWAYAFREKPADE